MKIIPLSSGSHGNSYVVKAGEDTILIEAGLSQGDLKHALWDYDLNVKDISLCLASHQHLDHFKSVEWLSNRGVKVGLPSSAVENGSFKRLIRKDRLIELEPYKTVKQGNWYIKPFELEHDGVDNLGFLLLHALTDERLFYATDTAYIKEVPQGINYMMIEVNYQKKYLEESVKEGTMSRENMRRITRSHMSLQTALDFLKACDLSKTKQIYALHLSGRNSNAEEIREAIQEETGVATYIAK